jgi:HPt (histidine-containing phosphotransfer) domain-containing protein
MSDHTRRASRVASAPSPFEIAVDAAGRVAGVGAALARLLPELRDGVRLQDHFVVVEPAGLERLEDAAGAAPVALQHGLLDLELRGPTVPRSGGGRILSGRLVLGHPAQVEELGLDDDLAASGWVAHRPAAPPSSTARAGAASPRDLTVRAADAIDLPTSLIVAFASDLDSAADELDGARGIDAVRAVAHRVAGSTGAYGYPALSDEIRALASELRRPAAAWRAVGVQLAATCRQAAAAIASSGGSGET